MRKVRLYQGQRALVFKNRELVDVLEAGSHWVGFGVSIEIHEMSTILRSKIDMKLLLQNDLVREHLHIVDVKDHELVLVHADGHFDHTLSAGQYAYWKGWVEYEFTRCDLSQVEITENLSSSALRRAEVLQHIRMIKVETHQKALLFIDGKVHRVLEAGHYHFWKNEISVEVQKVDTRTQILEISGQEILTKDKAAIRINYDVQYQVVDIERALLENEQYQKQLYVFAQLALRSYIGSLTLDELLEQREAVSGYVQGQLSDKAQTLGLKAISSGIKDIILTGEMKEIMNRVLIAQKQAEANVITRREETASTRSLLNTAKLMEDNTMLFKLKEMEYIEKIADKINSISVSGGSQIAGQLKELFGSG